ncbi:hypothetical protein B0H14DRAFT_3062866 [Mycena olivaceomarginata]|nr:hypothetical protein B0H14DRAFT_3062866 [Mycena olivaceomarginata]
MSLPQELLDLVINNICNIPSLKTCSLACTAFRYSSQSRLFSRVTLPWLKRGTTTTKCCLFYRLVTESPHIQPYVRTLVIMDRDIHITPSRRFRTEWLLDDTTLPLLLPLLRNLESFHMHAWLSWDLVLESKKNPPLTSAISTALASPNIRSIHFRGIDIPPSCIAQSPGLQDLLLNDLEIIDTATVVAPDLRIRRLGLSPQALDWFSRIDCPFDTRHLPKIRVCPRHYLPQASALQALLTKAAKSLLELEYLPFRLNNIPHHLDLGNLSSLQHLRVWITWRPITVGHIRWLAGVLDSLPPNSSIQHINIHLGQTEPIELAGELRDAFAVLDASLTRPALLAVQVTIYLAPAMGFDGFLPVLASSGRLRIDNSAMSFDSLRYADL